MLHAIIMAGGTGTRFWPASRNDSPKQMLELVGGETMIRQTVDRLGDLVPPERRLVVTNRRLVDAMRRAVARVAGGGDRRRAVQARHGALHRAGGAVGEPRRSGRDDGRDAGRPCDPPGREVSGRDPPGGGAGRRRRPAGLSRLASSRRTRPRSSATSSAAKPIDAAADDGSLPRSSSTASRKSRTPRPPGSTSSRANTIGTPASSSGGRRRFSTRSRSGSPRCSATWKRSSPPGTRRTATPCSTASSPRSSAISIDYAVMEHAADVAVIEAPFEWDDLGGWQSLARLAGTDDDGNTIIGRHLGLDTKGTIVRTDDDHLVVTLGLEDCIVVHTPNATLVANKHDEEKIRQIVKDLESRGWTEYL